MSISNAYMFGDHDPVHLEIRNPQPEDLSYMAMMGAVAVTPLFAGVAFSLEEHMIAAVAERWKFCEVTSPTPGKHTDCIPTTAMSVEVGQYL